MLCFDSPDPDSQGYYSACLRAICSRLQISGCHGLWRDFFFISGLCLSLCGLIIIPSLSKLRLNYRATLYVIVALKDCISLCRT